MDRVTELELSIRDAQRELQEIREDERREKMDQHVGKFFKYRNCYSCPESPRDYWFLYIGVIKRGKDIVSLGFQIDKYGKVDIESKPFFLSDGWDQITRREFMAELTKVKRRIEELESL